MIEENYLNLTKVYLSLFDRKPGLKDRYDMRSRLRVTRNLRQIVKIYD